jgi:plasmid stabilization system protein ParE
VRVVFHPEADAELSEAVAYYGEIEEALGERFLQEIKRLVGELSAHPKTFRLYDPPARRHFSFAFPYAVIYLEQEDHLWIVALMHMKREPSYWKERLG